MNEIINELYHMGVLPIINTDNTENLISAAQTINNTGISAMALTYHGETTEAAIEKISRDYPNMFVGALSVLDVKQAGAVIDAGAKIVICHGFYDDVVRYCMSRGVLVIPCVNNATQINEAISHGVEVVGFFPSELSGGIKMIQTLSKAYSKIKFMPLGGINNENIYSYLSIAENLFVGMEFDVDKNMAENSVGVEIKKTVDALLSFSLRHIGMNCVDNEVSHEASTTLSDCFSFGIRECNASYFVNESFELMKFIGRGTNGHIAISTPNVDRAVYHLEKRGVKFDYQSAKYNEFGKMIFIYLQDEIAGFAYHLVEYIK